MTEAGPGLVSKVKPNKVFKGMIAGGIVGGLSELFVYPADFIKTRMQIDRRKQSYGSTLECVKKTINRHGILGLYRGASIMLLGSVFKVSSRFGTYEFFSNEFREPNGKTSLSNTFLSGMLAGMLEGVLVITPLEAVRLRIINDMHNHKPRYNGLLHGLRIIAKQEGIRGIYRGVTVTVLRQGTNQAVRFFLMVTQKDFYRNSDETVIVPMPLVGVFGVIAGAASILGNTPLDVLKTRMQSMKSYRNKTILQNVITMLRDEGPRAFYKGSVMRMTRVCIDVALTFMLYETLMEYAFS